MQQQLTGGPLWGLLCLQTALSLVGCTPVTVPSFDATRAYNHVLRQVDFGPRVPGSSAHLACSEWLVAQLEETGASVEVQGFELEIAGRKRLFRNIIARYGPELDQRILLGAHWDTRPISEQDPDPRRRTQPTPGANDGASGVAVLIEVGRLLGLSELPVGVDIVLFDGEDLGDFARGWSEVVLGSQHFATTAKPELYRHAIVLDMVGRRGLNIMREGNSLKCCPQLMKELWSIAGTLGKSGYFDAAPGPDIMDDHMPLQKAGIKAVDLIDLRDPHWHTTADTPDKVSLKSLEAVGVVLWEHLRRESGEAATQRR